MERSHTVSAASALVVAASGWALAPIFIRYLCTVYDPHTQNLLRYASAAVPLLIISLVGFRADLGRAFRAYAPFVAISALNVLQQHVWTLGCAGATATTAQFVTKLSVVFVILFSFFVFHEERAVIKSPIYLLGTLLSLVGVAGIISDDPASLWPVFDFATVMLIITAVLWAVYTVWAKHLVKDIHPVPMFTVMSVYTTLGFGILAPVAGHPATLITAGGRPVIIGIVSGLIPIALAHPCYHYAQRRLGSAFCSSVNLLNPLATYAVAMFIFPDEQLRLPQWIGAAILVFGTFLVVYAGKRAHNSRARATPKAAGTLRRAGERRA